MSFFANIRVRLPDYLDKIVRNDATGGILMMFCTVLALVLQNGSYSTSYRHWLEMQAGIIFGDFQLIKPLLLWINDGLITIFFFSIGLELKIEFIKGHLSQLSNVVMPCLGAIAGIIVPSLFFVAFNYDNAYAMRGWAIPTSTDTAFSLAIILLLGSRVPVSLRVFLLSMAIFDDIGAILVIALFYTSELSAPALVSASFAILCLLGLNYFGVARKMFYLFFGVILWFSIFKSGMHATLAGIITAFCIPMKSASGEVMVERIYENLKMWVALLVLPVFTIANAGVDLSMIDIEGFLSPVSLGIFTGLFFGKQLGIFAIIWLCIKLKIVQAPADATFKQIYGVCILTGIGFSMSMFIDSLAYQGSAIFEYADSLAILVASLCSGVFGYCFLRFYACRTLELEYRPWLPAPGGYKGTASTADLYIPSEGASSVAPTAVAVAEANARAAAAAKAAAAAEEAAAAAAAAADAAKKVVEDETDPQSVAQVQLAAAQAAAAAASAAVSSTHLDTDPDQDTNEVATAALEAAEAAADIAAEVAEAVEAEKEAADAEAESAETSEDADDATDDATTESAADTSSDAIAGEATTPDGAAAESAATSVDAATVVEEGAQSASSDAAEAPATAEGSEVTPLSVESIPQEDEATEIKAPTEDAASEGAGESVAETAQVVEEAAAESHESESAESNEDSSAAAADLDLALHADAVKAALEAEESGENPQEAAAAAVAQKSDEVPESAPESVGSEVSATTEAAAAATAAGAAKAKAPAAAATKEEKKAVKEAKKAEKVKEKESKSKDSDEDDFAEEYFKNVVKLAQAEVLEPHLKHETKGKASFSSEPDANLTEAAAAVSAAASAEATAAPSDAAVASSEAPAAAQAESAPSADTAATPEGAGAAESTEAATPEHKDLALHADAVAAAIEAEEAQAQSEVEAEASAGAHADAPLASDGVVNFSISQDEAQLISTEVSRQVAVSGENMETVDTTPALNKDLDQTHLGQDFAPLKEEGPRVEYTEDPEATAVRAAKEAMALERAEVSTDEAQAPVAEATPAADAEDSPAQGSGSEAVPVEEAKADSAEQAAGDSASEGGVWQKLTQVLKKDKD